MHVIAISSFKGGTAKTSTSLHIGSALCQFHKKKVLLIDFDAQANLTTGLGLDPDEQDSMAPVLQGEKTIEDVILPTCVPNMDIIPADTWLERVEVSGSLAADRYSHERLKRNPAPARLRFHLHRYAALFVLAHRIRSHRFALFARLRYAGILQRQRAAAAFSVHQQHLRTPRTPSARSRSFVLESAGQKQRRFFKSHRANVSGKTLASKSQTGYRCF